jgi:hypothetical protein
MDDSTEVQKIETPKVVPMKPEVSWWQRHLNEKKKQAREARKRRIQVNAIQDSPRFKE